MAKKKVQYNYRQIFKALRKFFDFSFKIPHYKKDFTPQQKSSITRKYKKLLPYLTNQLTIDTDEVTYLKYPQRSNKLKNIDGIRLDHGMIYKWPQARLIKSPLEFNTYFVEINPKKRYDKKRLTMRQKFRDVFIPFPAQILNDLNKIRAFVRYVAEKFHPHEVMWSIKDKRERDKYDPDVFDLYFSNEFLEGDDYDVEENADYQALDFVDRAWVWKRRNMRHKYDRMPNYYNGVFITKYF